MAANNTRTHTWSQKPLWASIGSHHA